MGRREQDRTRVEGRGWKGRREKERGEEKKIRQESQQ